MIGRRGAIGGLMTWWAAGNARTPQGPQSREGNRPDRKPLGVTRAGVGPAPQQNIIRALLVIVGGTGVSGVFTYSGTPGSGDLSTSQTQSTKDPFGTTTVPGITAYVPGTPATNVNMSAGSITFNQSGVNTAASEGSNSSASFLLSSGKVNSTDVPALFQLIPALTGIVPVAYVGNAALEIEESAVPAADGGVAAGPKLFGNTSGHMGVVSDSLHGDGNDYDIERLTLVCPLTTINSNVTRVNVFSQHLGVGTYDYDLWLVTQNTTAADAAAWSFAASGGLVIGAGSLVDFESKTTGTAVVGYAASSTFSTAFNGQGTAGNQQLLSHGTLVVTTAGTLTFGGLELVAGNTVTVSAGGKLRIMPVVATS